MKPGSITDRIRAAARQEQFLEVLSRTDAEARFRAAVPHRALEAERVPLAECLDRLLAEDVRAPIDLPPFDRSSVDGFAVRSADTLGASEARPVRLSLNGEVLACGTAPAIEVGAGTATAISTGGMVPRGADAVVMIEHTQFDEGADGAFVLVRRAVAPGGFIAFAGSDVARGETILRPGQQITSREIGILAACGFTHAQVVRRPRVGIISTGDELHAPGETLAPGGIYDSNGAITAAAVAENGGVAVPFGIIRDDETALARAVASALESCDLVVMSGGTSKGAGDVSHRILSALGAPGIVVHGVALKPGKPLCLAAVGRTPVIVLPGFPTSAIFTFHEFAVPLVRAMAGLPARREIDVSAHLPVRAPSEIGRTEYVMVSLGEGPNGLTAFPLSRGSGSVTAFSAADGFFAIDALASEAEAGSQVEVRLIGHRLSVPDLVFAGSHDIGLDALVGLLARRGLNVRTLAIGSMAGLAAVKRGECDLAPVHLLDPKTGTYNAPFLAPGLALVPGWRRRQGVVFRRGHRRFEGMSAQAAIASAAQDERAILINRNAGSGTRILLDGALDGQRPAGYANQPRSHNAVAAAIAQGRADWGLAIETVAQPYGLGFLPLADEHYDFFLAEDRRSRPAVAAFLEILSSAEARETLTGLGFTPADGRDLRAAE